MTTIHLLPPETTKKKDSPDNESVRSLFLHAATRRFASFQPSTDVNLFAGCPQGNLARKRVVLGLSRPSCNPVYYNSTPGPNPAANFPFPQLTRPAYAVFIIYVHQPPKLWEWNYVMHIQRPINAELDNQVVH